MGGRGDYIPIEDTLDLLEQGEKYLQIAKNKNVVLVFGETDKTPLVHFLAGDDQNSISQIGQNNGKPQDGWKAESSSLVPSLVIDRSSDTVFYDFPAFRNWFPSNSSPEERAKEIAAAYFTEKVISAAESVKILFVLSYDTVTRTNSGNLHEFATHATHLIKNLNSLRGSIGLVVTDDGSSASPSDQEIRTAVGNYNYMVLKTTEGKENESNLLEILLEKVSLQMNPRVQVGKIGIWRKRTETHPNNEGEKRLLREIVLRYLVYARKNTDDFSYELTSITNPQKHLVNHARELLIEIGDQLIGLYRDVEQSSHYIEELNEVFHSANKAIYGTENIDPLNVLKRSLQTVDKMKFVISKERLIRLVSLGKYLKFLDRVYRKYVSSVTSGENFTSFQRYLENSEVWYWCLSEMLNAGLASHDIQGKINPNKEKLLKDEANDLKNKLSNKQDSIMGYYACKYEQFRVNIGNVDSFKKFIKTHKSVDDGSTTFEAEDKKRELLSKVVEVILEENSGSVKCQDNRLTISGRFAKTSEIKERLKTCLGEVMEVELFAIQKIFIDADLDFTGKEIQLSFMAPEWEVIGDRKIILDGKPGEAREKIVENKNVLEGSDGKPGEPGKAGGPAGQFVGVANNCLHCERMTVSLIGGEGGPGQDGGNGSKGKDGRRPYDPTLDRSYTSMEDRWAATRYLSNFTGQMSKPYCWVTAYIYPDEEYQCHVKGEMGQKGGKGGDGGKGGLGGLGGNYGFVMGSNWSRNPYFSKEDGKTGAAGKKGSPGMGGTHGDTYKLVGRHNVIDDKVGGWLFSKLGKYQSNTTAPMGDQGINGNNGNETEMEKNRRTLLDIELSYPVSHYKAYLRSKLGKTVVPKKGREFLTFLDTEKRVTEIYNVLGLVKDIQSLEDQFGDLLPTNIPLIPYYINLRERVYYHSQNLSKTGENDNDHKLALSYLYSLILIRIRNINNKFNDGLVLDVFGHLQQALREIDNLKKKNEAVHRNKSKQSYKGEIETKVKEADNLINDVVEPAIRAAITGTDEQIVTLIKETLNFKETAEKQQDELILKQQTLKDQLVLRYLLGTVQVTSQLLALAGPVGAAVGTAIGGATQVAQGLLLTDEDGNHNLKDIPEGAKKSYDGISEYFKQKKKAFETQLADAEKSLNQLGREEQGDQSIQKIRQGIKQAEAELAKHKPREDDFVDPEALDKMYNTRNKLTKLMDEEKQALSQTPSKNDQSLLKKIDFVGKAKIIFEAGKVGKSVYDEIMKSGKSIDKLGDSIKKASDDITKLEQQEKKIHDTIKQTCDGLRKGVDEMRRTASGKSHAALEVSKWQIQNNLGDISQKLKAMTDGYKGQGKLLFLISQVEHGMNTMILIYDRIQEYQDAAQLADYLSYITINGANLGSVKNDELRSAVNYLDQNMQFNMVLNAYEKTINGLKLAVFPLAGSYTRLPKEEFVFEYNATKSYKIESLVESMKEEFNSILSELRKDMTDSRPIHRCIHKDQPYMKNHKPFYTWKFPANDETIAQLLKGKEISLIADVSAKQVEELEQDAIKFSMIGIKFNLPRSRMTTQTDQDSLKRYLSGFKVNMTHQGDSHYRACGKSFTIKHGTQVIETYINKDTPGEQIGNEQFDQLRSRKAMLSPYTTWKINLFEDKSVREEPSFLKLQNLLRNRAINIELEGRGSYISRKYPADELICNTWRLKEFYEEDTPKGGIIQPQIQNDLSGLIDEEETVRSLLGEQGEIPEGSDVSDSTGFKAAVKYLNPVNWFIRDNASPGGSDYFNSSVTTSLPSSSFTDRPSKLITYGQTSSVDGHVDTGLMNMQSNLMLMGLLVPKTNVRSKRSSKLDTLIDNFAHDMAYKAHVPSDSSKK